LSLLSLQNVEVSFGAEDVLRGVSGEINLGDRIGLVGRNGAGKTTLLHVLSGELAPTAGARHVSRGTSIALVEQVQSSNDSNGSVYSEALSAVSELIDLEDALERAGEDLSEGKPGAAERYSRLQDEFEAKDGYMYRTRVSQVLIGLGFAEVDWSEPVAQLSGGQRTRLALAKALLAKPDLLLLDEPTNHIDIEAMTWLDSFLARWPGTLVVTSHDRYFLDRVANRIWLLEQGTNRTYRGNYAAFENQRRAEIELLRRQAEMQAEFIAKEEAFIRRYGAGQRAREARGRQTRLDRVERIDAPREQRASAFRLKAARSGDLVLIAEDLTVGYGEPGLLGLGTLEVRRGDRIAFIGPNGSGKTTLLRTIAGELPPVRGKLRLGANVRLGHYWQEAENLDPTRTVLEEMRRGRVMEPQQARGLLGRFLFSGDEVDKPVSALSGGERSRLALAKLVIEEANLLLLDEPTNHLDIPSRESLEQALAAYPGTFILVSHDRQLIADVANQLWIVEDGRVRVFEGTYGEYVERTAAAERVAEVPPQPPKPRPAAPRGNGHKAGEIVARLEADIESREQELAALGEQINAASAAGDVGSIDELGKRFEESQRELESLMEAWEGYHA
jgi:ATP-binding cassette subfamily F protein 3